MNAEPVTRGRGLVATALTSVADWLVEPASAPAPAGGLEREASPRPVIAVAGLRRRDGVTTVARAIGALLAAADSSGACVVTAGPGGAGIPLGLPAAGRLARRVAPLVDARVRACGRLCLAQGAEAGALCAAARELAPVVLDVSEPAEAAMAASVADHVVLVAGPEAEPSLAVVVAESLAMVGPRPAVLLNRGGRASERWAAEAHVALPESRLGAQLAGAGREPRGPMGDAVADLVDELGVVR